MSRRHRWDIPWAAVLALALAACGGRSVTNSNENTPSECGNGILEPEEECDDGNASAHDGCSDQCETERRTWWLAGSADEYLAREGHAMVYDPMRGHALLFGGYDIDPGFFADTRLLVGTELTLVETDPGPPARTDAAMAYDSGRDRVVLFGGRNAFSGPDTALDDTWELDGDQWTAVPQSVAPSPRTDHAMAYDASRQRIVLHGGTDDGHAYEDTWEFDGQVWSEVSTTEAPVSGRAMTYHPTRGTVMLLGETPDGVLLWELRDGDWVWLNTPTLPPTGPWYQLVYDGSRDRLVLLGTGGPPDAAGTWEFDGADWTRVETDTLPGSYIRHAVVYDAARGCPLLFGGYQNTTGRLAEVWEYRF